MVRQKKIIDECEDVPYNKNIVQKRKYDWRIGMQIFEVAFIGIGLAMDAFAVSICKGLQMRKINYRFTAIIAGFFGAFQAIMPLIGWFLGKQFQRYIVSVDHWIIFVLLGMIGINMIRESREREEEIVCANEFEKLDYRELVLLAIATSIDALAVGVTFAFLKVNIVSSVLLIGIITFIITFGGIAIGNIFGMKYKSKAELFGGVVLVLMGVKILLEHLGILSF